jgi:hypothetical protein
MNIYKKIKNVTLGLGNIFDFLNVHPLSPGLTSETILLYLQSFLQAAKSWITESNL